MTVNRSLLYAVLIFAVVRRSRGLRNEHIRLLHVLQVRAALLRWPVCRTFYIHTEMCITIILWLTLRRRDSGFVLSD